MSQFNCNARHTQKESFGIELYFEEQRHEFVLSKYANNTIEVGSQAEANLRIARPGVAPMHFHIERDDDRVWIVPACGSGALVDGARLAAPRVIVESAVVEFSGIRIYVRVIRDTPSQRPLPTLIDAVTLDGDETLFDPIPAATQTSTTRTVAQASPEPEVLSVVNLHQPRVIWLGGSLLVFTVSATLTAGLRCSHDTRTGDMPPLATSLHVHGKPIENSNVSYKATHEQRPPVDTPSKPFPSETDDSRNGKLRTAANHLLAGRYAAAQRDYTSLATSNPTLPALAVLSKLLSIRTSERCVGKSTSSTSCPDIKQ